jgi:hypothetical protein
MLYQPLNPVLYEALRDRFGDVEVVSPGVAIAWRTFIPCTADSDRPFRRVMVQGEEYKLRCPFCHDWRPRMFVNHMWGVWDEATQSRNLWMVNCFNENCFADSVRREQLYLMTYGNCGVQHPVKILPGRTSHANEPVQARPPGFMTRFDKLAERHPQHHAIQYLRSRGFDPVKLGRLYGVAYCPQSQFYHASDRIIIPVYERGTLYGWQARYIGDDVNGQSFKEAGIPKYYTMPGMKRKLLGYNTDHAVRHQTILVVEGPTDVWRVGPQAFGLLGKTVSPFLATKLRRQIGHYWGGDAVVAVQDCAVRQRCVL